ncbi:hypothetical protein BGW36DRAFT_183840 [Talaromyces proteolyticus]|uniref:Uncharacterized protein n=1 Tax=Talaromyces proteolyticus TaxID=1131652 RepID=A0AAD4KP31_9EURO|nr:uncharacterized protein BGW36DRAFT_183840 [Talaromyces proteolyticus]KAH8696264.1 hypothetical protein BGW36DRAFT_183840 [Talaromyces proteolyticus]
MAQQPQGLSRTLPKSFTFPSIPRTPEHCHAEPEVPPPPHHSSYRIRRPRFGSEANVFASIGDGPNIFDLSRPDVPLPSIEFPSSDAVSEPELPALESVASDLLQVPALRRMEFKTPPAQIRTTPYNFPRVTPERLDNAEDDPIERPSSRASDSSVSSNETYVTQPSLGGSCTSPESEIYDPFGFHPEDTRKYLLETPSSRVSKRGQSLDVPKDKSRWTKEMDNHLWNTYQIYLQDPTITPFKMLPGSLPPLGVSHRVAREAKKTWNRLKAKPDTKTAQDNEAVPSNIRRDNLQAETRSGSSTPTGAKSTSVKPRWPRSEATTRRRLKFLCRRKFSIAPHYQRLLASRSPSVDPFVAPAQETPGQGPTSNTSTAFGTRDLGVSLVSSSLPATFTQMATASPTSMELSSSDNWFNDPQSQPLQPPSIQVSAAPAVSAVAEPFPRLGSPFMYNTWGPDTSHRELRTPARKIRRDTVHVSGSRLRSPPRMDLGSNVHKRRAHNRLDASPASSDIQRNIRDLARDGKLKDGQRRVRLRNRGNTTSGGFSSKERIEQLFSPTSPFTFPGNSRNQQIESQDNSQELLRPRSDTVRRLGSPFKLDEKPRFHYPKSPRHAPSLSDSFTTSSMNTEISTNFGGEAFFAKDETSSVRLPYDPTEEGISDAERIRRQILNLPFTKN